MAYEPPAVQIELTPAFIEGLQSDFKTLSNESKKKYPQVKEVFNLYNSGHVFINKLTF